MTKKETIRLNVPIELELNEKLDKQASKMGISKAGFIRVVLYDYFKQQEALSFVNDFDKMIEVLEKAKSDK